MITCDISSFVWSSLHNGPPVFLLLFQITWFESNSCRWTKILRLWMWRKRKRKEVITKTQSFPHVLLCLQKRSQRGPGNRYPLCRDNDTCFKLQHNRDSLSIFWICIEGRGTVFLPKWKPSLQVSSQAFWATETKRKFRDVLGFIISCKCHIPYLT